MAGSTGGASPIGVYSRLADYASEAILLMDTRPNAPWFTNLPCGLGSDKPEYAYVGYETYANGANSYVGSQHNNGANFLFADGRVEWHKRNDYQPGWEGNPFALLPTKVLNGQTVSVAQR
jgi:prepilin-type processing-associated H-X9-DG protein